MAQQERVALITGGVGDIGQAIARRLRVQGLRIVLLDLVPQMDGRAVAAALGEGITYRQCDVTDRAQVEAAFAEEEQIYVAIANAGVVLGDQFLSVSEESWHTTMEVNLTGTFHIAQVAAKRMVQQSRDVNGVRGKVLFTGSWTQNRPCPRSAIYGASKAGVQMLAQCMAQELADEGVLVNVVAPGAVDGGITRRTYAQNAGFREQMAGMVPLKTLQPVDSVAGAFAYLCSSDADHMTGSTMVVDGGLSLLSCQV
ncbi:SDR family oxidoreductase [Caenibius sp. WL]|uniref:SDR family NAD(P)-dependent oxidoreductase n=1 Tax=Caenibius sp. WL TaxID=2872646 RepID=UPI001C999D08|nr:SDR family oxidoreductase [Caenibius sp. WL]QZP09537.1 SDR family oxidoreductase [Caenibius sp. WL]